MEVFMGTSSKKMGWFSSAMFDCRRLIVTYCDYSPESVPYNSAQMNGQRKDWWRFSPQQDFQRFSQGVEGLLTECPLTGVIAYINGSWPYWLTWRKQGPNNPLPVGGYDYWGIIPGFTHDFEPSWGDEERLEAHVPSMSQALCRGLSSLGPFDSTLW